MKKNLYVTFNSQLGQGRAQVPANLCMALRRERSGRRRDDREQPGATIEFALHAAREDLRLRRREPILV
ncbi:hypothetical protein [Caulobacter sp. AP07]|uniref:hypothetical protein n=1 Tax=Caulobacter sp. AP07 TaxID=1144304 RepID=UPI001EE6837F|nr:hypothetical protein [Caulobacter sp. AP07]